LKDCHHYMNFFYVHLLIHMAESLELHCTCFAGNFPSTQTSHVTNPLSHSLSETWSTRLATTYLYTSRPTIINTPSNYVHSRKRSICLLNLKKVPLTRDTYVIIRARYAPSPGSCSVVRNYPTSCEMG
jgi:hypothetical protein